MELQEKLALQFGNIGGSNTKGRFIGLNEIFLRVSNGLEYYMAVRFTRSRSDEAKKKNCTNSDLVADEMIFFEV